MGNNIQLKIFIILFLQFYIQCSILSVDYQLNRYFKMSYFTFEDIFQMDNKFHNLYSMIIN